MLKKTDANVEDVQVEKESTLRCRENALRKKEVLPLLKTVCSFKAFMNQIVAHHHFHFNYVSRLHVSN